MLCPWLGELFILTTCMSLQLKSFIHSLIHLIYKSFTHSLTHSLIHSIYKSFIHSFIHSIYKSLIHSLVDSNWCRFPHYLSFSYQWRLELVHRREVSFLLFSSSFIVPICQWNLSPKVACLSLFPFSKDTMIFPRLLIVKYYSNDYL